MQRFVSFGGTGGHSSAGYAGRGYRPPKPNWPIFTGDDEWSPFFARFNAVFRQQGIPESEKYDYLVSTITKSAGNYLYRLKPELKCTVGVLAVHMASIYDKVETT